MTITPQKSRIESIDLLRGVVMVIMALDHVRDYFHFGAFFGDPTDMATTTPILFFTRFISHYCAPVFVFLSGTSAYLWGSNKTKGQLFKFLFTRGIWLIFLELTVNTFIWTFDITLNLNIFQVIWAIGFSMVSLSVLIYLPKQLLLMLGLAIIAGHNLLDTITFDGSGVQSVMWYLLHQEKGLMLSPDKLILFHYPVLAWIGVIILGYCFGSLYGKGVDPEFRKKRLLQFGFGGLTLFFLVRGINIYGNLEPWAVQRNAVYTMLSFLNTTKYPPSLSYILMTLSPALLFLYFTESIKNKVTDFFLIYGRVPLFYYFTHVFLIHVLAIIVLIIMGGDWHALILNSTTFMTSSLSDYGYPLWVVYVVWAAVVVSLYPFCKRYMIYKAENTQKWWLSYL